MKITEDLLSKRNSNGVNEATPAALASSTDVDFFRSALLPSHLPVAQPTQVSNLLSVASSALTRSTDQLKKSLNAISKKGDEELLSQFPNQLSGALFQSQILVKSLGKTTQCIDKICNLQ
jgi:hypothetical protein